MFRLVLMMIVFCFGSLSLARVSAYFPFSVDRVMIDIQSGNPMYPSSDDDGIRLFEAMNVSAENSMMGKGKTIQLEPVLSIIVADRGKGQFDGVIMVNKGPGVFIDKTNKVVEVRLTGKEALFLSEKFKKQNGAFEYLSVDGRLKLVSDNNQFLLSFTE